MKENIVQNLVALETVKPNRTMNRSAGAVYFTLIAAVLATILAANHLFTHWQIPRGFVQLPIYAILVGTGLYFYRWHYVSYRYTLTDQTFAVDRIAGSAERHIAAVLLTDIESIGPSNETTREIKCVINASVRRKRQSIRITAILEGQRTHIMFSPSEEFYRALLAQQRMTAKREST